MNKKAIIFGSIGAVILLILVGYFLIIPTVQINNYKNTVATKHSELNVVLNKLGSVLERDTFVKTELEPATVHSDVKFGNEAVKSVEAKLVLVKNDLTGFSALPLLAFNEKYKTAIDLKADEQQYISKIEAFVAEMKSVLSYMDKNADLMVKTAEFATALEAADQAESAAEYAAKIDGAVTKLQPSLDELAKQTPPASLREGHDYSVKALNEYTVMFKDLAAAVRANDANKVSAIGEKILAKSDEITKKTDDYNAKFIRESDLRKLDDTLNQLDRDIDRKQASL